MKNFSRLCFVIAVMVVYLGFINIAVGGAGDRFVNWSNTITEFPIGAWSYVSSRNMPQSWFDEYRAANLNMIQVNTGQLVYTKSAGLNVVLGTWDKYAEDYITYNQALIDARTLAQDASNRVTIFCLKDDLPRYEYTGSPFVSYYHQYDGINHVANYHIYSLPSSVMTQDNFLPVWANVSMYGKTYWTLVDEGFLRCNPAVSAHCNYPQLADGTLAPDYFQNLVGFRNRSWDVVGSTGPGIFGLVGLCSYDPGGGYARPNRQATITDARFQVHCQLAYGAKGIWWYFYQKKPSGMETFGDGYLDLNNNQTSLYSICQEINRRTLNWGKTLIGIDTAEPLKSTQVSHIPNSAGGIPAGVKTYAFGDASTYLDFQVDSTHTTGGVCVGYFNWPWSSQWCYVMVVNMQHGAVMPQSVYTRNITVKFKSTLLNKRYVSWDDGLTYELTLPPAQNGWHTQTFSLEGGDAMFFALKKP